MKTVFLIVNGSLEMSSGKLCAQTFQACQRLLDKESERPDLAKALESWREDGTRTRTKIAPTQHLFDRAVADLVPQMGVIMIDEGKTEVEPNTATVIATYPLDEDCLPRILRHKRIKTMQDQEAKVAYCEV